MENKIEYADRGHNHAETKRSYILALIHRPTDKQKRAALKARIKAIVEK